MIDELEIMMTSSGLLGFALHVLLSLAALAEASFVFFAALCRMKHPAYKIDIWWRIIHFGLIICAGVTIKVILTYQLPLLVEFLFCFMPLQAVVYLHLSQDAWRDDVPPIAQSKCYKEMLNAVPAT